MTFVVGFNAANGLVMCADSLEKDGFVKRRVDKLRTYYPTSKWGVCIGGSGPSAILKSFIDKFFDSLGNDSFDLGVFEARTEACLKAMYSKYPDETFSFLIAVFSNSAPFTARMYRTEGICLSPVDSYACIGQDSTLANFFLSTIWSTTMESQECAVLGALCTGLMCDHGDGVERPIKVVLYNLGMPFWTHWPDEAVEQYLPVTELEDLIREFWKRKNYSESRS